MFRFFCLSCPWKIGSKYTDAFLWIDFATCPDCFGYTDAVKIPKEVFANEFAEKQ